MKAFNRPELSIIFMLLSLCTPALTFAHSAQQTTACTTARASADPTASVCLSRVKINADGTSVQNFFFVSWLSSRAEPGQVILVGTAKTYDDTCEECHTGTAHYVKVDNLKPNTTYQFDIKSGGRLYTNGGAHWAITTGEVLQPRNPDTIVGRVKNPDGSDAEGALIYVQIQDANGSGSAESSSLLSGVAQDLGFFGIDLGEARLPNLIDYFVYTGTGTRPDKLVIKAVSPRGTASTTVDASQPRPGKPSLTLTLGSGTGTITTATPLPTSAPQTATLTPTITPTLTLTVTPTEISTFTATAPVVNTARPSTTRQLFVEPTLVNTPEIIIEPADITPTLAATAEATEEPRGEPTTTRVIRRATATPAAARVGGIATVDSLFIVIALVAFVGAAVLGIAAVYVWRR